MKNKNLFINFGIVLIFFLVSFFLIKSSSSEFRFSHIKYVKIAEQNIKVDLALTRESHAQGLSGRESLSEGEGMLFVFEKVGKYFFWMKDMNFAIDIIWIGEDMKIVYIKKDARPENFLETYGPDVDIKYVLEVVSGFADKNNLKVGDRVEFGY